MGARLFTDRRDAGRRLGAALAPLALRDPVVLALPRGGVPVAAEIAAALHAPLDLLLVRKIGAPRQRELAIAAVAEGGAVAVNDELVRAAGATREYIDAQAQEAVREIERRRQLYLGGRAPLPVAGRSAVVVDDGVATGATVRAALLLLRQRAPARIVLAVPVAPADTIEEMRRLVDTLVCLQTPERFHAVGAFYRDFDQVEDAEVIACLRPPQPPGVA